MTDAFSSSLNSTASTLNTAASRFNTAASSIPSRVNVDMSDIPQYASGGPAGPGLAIVGEQGPELVKFNRPGYVFNAQETAGMTGRGNAEIDGLRREVQALAVMQSKTLKLWQRVTRDGESLRTVAA